MLSYSTFYFKWLLWKFYFFFLEIDLEFEPGALHMLGKPFPDVLHPQSLGILTYFL